MSGLIIEDLQEGLGKKTATRANGLVSMIEQMKLYAKAITLKNK